MSEEISNRISEIEARVAALEAANVQTFINEINIESNYSTKGDEASLAGLVEKCINSWHERNRRPGGKMSWRGGI